MYTEINLGIALFSHPYHLAHLDMNLEHTQVRHTLIQEVDQILAVPVVTSAPATPTDTQGRREGGDESDAGIRDHDNEMSADDSVDQSVSESVNSGGSEAESEN